MQWISHFVGGFPYLGRPIRSSTKMVKPRITQTTPYDSAGIAYQFTDAKGFGEIPTGSPPSSQWGR